MSDDLHFPDDFEETRRAGPADLGETQRGAPTSRDVPPVPPHLQGEPYYGPPPRRERKQKRKRPPRRPRDSGLYLPLWSVIIMLMFVLGIAFGLIFLVVNIGGQNAPDAEPIIRIITAVPAKVPSGIDSVLASPTIPPDYDLGIQTPIPTFALEGPTLEPVVFSPTPEVISVGRTVIVYDVHPNQLNVRENPGINTNVLFRVLDGHVFEVVDGPQQVDGLTWWKVQDSASGESGWVASNYLQVVPEQ